jgi:hypothetical protein
MASLSEKFYNAVSGTGSALRRGWDVATGNALLQKRGIVPARGLKGELAFAGGAGGFFSGMFLAIVTSNIALWPAAVAVGLLMPVAGHLPYALFKAGEHDSKLRIAEEKRKLLEAPKASQKPDAPLI